MNKHNHLRNSLHSNSPRFIRLCHSRTVSPGVSHVTPSRKGCSQPTAGSAQWRTGLGHPQVPRVVNGVLGGVIHANETVSSVISVIMKRPKRQRRFWCDHRVRREAPKNRGRSKSFGTFTVKSTRKVAYRPRSVEIDLSGSETKIYSICLPGFCEGR